VTWKVHWSKPAEAELAELWMKSTDRDAVTAAATNIEKQLATDASEAGESRTDDIRVLCSLPLVVWFIVFPKSQATMVIHVRSAIRRGER
jgi:hypothetical protein